MLDQRDYHDLLIAMINMFVISCKALENKIKEKKTIILQVVLLSRQQIWTARH